MGGGQAAALEASVDGALPLRFARVHVVYMLSAVAAKGELHAESAKDSDVPFELLVVELPVVRRMPVTRGAAWSAPSGPWNCLATGAALVA